MSEAPGWDAIDAACERVYGKQEPLHYGTIIKYALLLCMFVVDRNTLYVTITKAVTVATRVSNPSVIASAAATAIHNMATYIPRGSSGYQLA